MKGAREINANLISDSCILPGCLPYYSINLCRTRHCLDASSSARLLEGYVHAANQLPAITKPLA
jgi:hypothetical protein